MANVYIVQSPKDDGGTYFEVFSREGAIKISRAAWRQFKSDDEDFRTDDQALTDFVIAHWAIEAPLLEG